MKCTVYAKEGEDVERMCLVHGGMLTSSPWWDVDTHGEHKIE